MADAASVGTTTKGNDMLAADTSHFSTLPLDASPDCLDWKVLFMTAWDQARWAANSAEFGIDCTILEIYVGTSQAVKPTPMVEITIRFADIATRDRALAAHGMSLAMTQEKFDG